MLDVQEVSMKGEMVKNLGVVALSEQSDLIGGIQFYFDLRRTE